MESRLHLVPRFRKRLAWVPGNIGKPVLVDDPSFDVAFHVRRTTLPEPRGVDEAKRLMEQIMSESIDRSRPLWQMVFFDLADNRTGFILKMHHSLVDGISGVDVGMVLLDAAPNPVKIDPPPYKPEPPPTWGELVRDAFVEGWSPPRDRISG